MSENRRPEGWESTCRTFSSHAEQQGGPMKVLYCRCCGLDVHKDSITACILVLVNGQRQVRIKEFKTYWKELQKLKLWLYSNKVECVAMEAEASTALLLTTFAHREVGSRVPQRATLKRRRRSISLRAPGRASPGPTPSISAHVLAAFALLDQFAGVWISKSKRRNEASNFLGKICILSLP